MSSAQSRQRILQEFRQKLLEEEELQRERKWIEEAMKNNPEMKMEELKFQYIETKKNDEMNKIIQKDDTLIESTMKKVRLIRKYKTCKLKIERETFIDKFYHTFYAFLIKILQINNIFKFHG